MIHLIIMLNILRIFNMRLRDIIIFAIILVYIQAQKAAYSVNSLDGYIDFTDKFQMYSGELVIQETPKLSIHFIFVTSMSNTSSTDPLVLWLNGGPGCSSLIGFAQQLGPNIMFPGSKRFEKYINEYSWNQNANLLFLESPPGVGFSTNQDPNYVYNQNNTALATYQALLKWFDIFQQYKTNKFWITGQSYCGMYIPFLAYKIYTQNKNVDPALFINLSGIMIGNGVMITDRHWRRIARNTFYAHHRFYGPEIDKLISSCTYSDEDDTTPSCIQGNRLADKAVEDVNPYGTISLCYGADTISKRPRRRYWYTPFFEQNNPLTTSGAPCTDDTGMTIYFNNKKVRNQLHVNTDVEWATCNQNIGEIYKKDATSIWVFNQIKNKIKIMLYSGNTDAVVSYIQTQRYIDQIGWKQISEKKAILNDLASLIGWKTEYDGLTYYVVNGAGHQVPTDKPLAGYFIFQEFLNST